MAGFSAKREIIFFPTALIYIRVMFNDAFTEQKANSENTETLVTLIINTTTQSCCFVLQIVFFPGMSKDSTILKQQLKTAKI